MSNLFELMSSSVISNFPPKDNSIFLSMFIHQILCRYLERVLATFIGQLISQEIIDARSFLLPIIMQM